MRANARIVTAEFVTEMTVASDVVHLETVAADVERVQDVALEKSCRPPAMVGLKQQLTIAGALRERHKLAGALASERSFASEICVEPEAPFGLEQFGTVTQFLSHFAGPSVGILHLYTRHAARDDQR